MIFRPNVLKSNEMDSKICTFNIIATVLHTVCFFCAMNFYVENRKSFGLIFNCDVFISKPIIAIYFILALVQSLDVFEKKNKHLNGYSVLNTEALDSSLKIFFSQYFLVVYSFYPSMSLHILFRSKV